MRDELKEMSCGRDDALGVRSPVAVIVVGDVCNPQHERATAGVGRRRRERERE